MTGADSKSSQLTATVSAEASARIEAPRVTLVVRRPHWLTSRVGRNATTETPGEKSHDRPASTGANRPVEPDGDRGSESRVNLSVSLPSLTGAIMRGIRKDSSSALAEPVARSERRLRTGEEATPRRDDIAAEAELVGLFQYGDLLRNRPRTLATWRVIAPRGCTVDRIAQLLGGDPQHDHKSGQAEVITESAAVGILLSGAGALLNFS